MTRHTEEYLRENSLSKLRTDLIAEWDYERNLKTPESLSLGSNYNAHWRCSVGHRFIQKVCHRTRKNGLGCPSCAGRLGTNIREGMPELFVLWDKQRNLDINPNKLSPGSQKEAWFKCSEEHSYKRRIGSVRVAILRNVEPCPYCNRTLPSAEYNLSAIFPGVSDDWDLERNHSRPSQHLPSENKIKYWWKCQFDHSYQMTINARTNQGSGCPYCAGQAVNDTNSLVSTNPELVKQWSFERNLEVRPEFVTAGSNKKVWWRCKYGHEWKAAIYSRASGKGCAKCSNQSSRPELRIFSEFDLLFDGVEHRANFNGQEYDIFLRDRHIGVEFDGSYYHKDINRDRKKNSIAEKSGVTLLRVREWPLDKIAENDVILDRDNVLKKQHIDLLINNIVGEMGKLEGSIQSYLAEEGFQNEAQFNELSSYLPGPLPGKSFAEHHPELISEWNFSKNSPIGPKDLSFGSNLKVSWQCKQGHSFEMSPKTRHSGQNCPFCSGRSVAAERTLGAKYPELIAEWDKGRNGEETPFDFTYASHFLAWWICPEGHSYQAKISSRTRKPKGSGCKVCFDTRGIRPKG